jgi:hypothetical protein
LKIRNCKIIRQFCKKLGGICEEKTTKFNMIDKLSFFVKNPDDFTIFYKTAFLIEVSHCNYVTKYYYITKPLHNVHNVVVVH